MLIIDASQQYSPYFFKAFCPFDVSENEILDFSVSFDSGLS